MGGLTSTHNFLIVFNNLFHIFKKGIFVLSCNFSASETHKCSLFSIVYTNLDASAAISLELVIYKTDDRNAEQLVTVFGLRVISTKNLKGSEPFKDRFALKLTTPEAHEAYSHFLQSNSTLLELFLSNKLAAVLESEELPC